MINGHNEDLDILNRTIHNFLTMKNNTFYKTTMTLNNHHLVIKMVTEALMEYIEVMTNYMGFYDTYNRVFEDFLSILDPLSNAKLKHQIIDTVTLERYLRSISYDLQRTSPIYELVFGKHIFTTQNYLFLLLIL